MYPKQEMLSINRKSHQRLAMPEIQNKKNEKRQEIGYMKEENQRLTSSTKSPPLFLGVSLGMTPNPGLPTSLIAIGDEF